MMTVKFLLKALSIAFLFLCGAGVDALAQAPVATPTPSCPNVSVSSPDSVNAGQPLTMSVDISGGDPNVTPTYSWSVSASMIEEGQGTSSITIATKGIKKDSAITATVDVGGYDRSCSTSSSGTTVILAGGAEARLYDDFVKLPDRDVNVRLKNFALELGSDATAQGYIIVSPLRSAKVTAQQVANKAKAYLTKKQRIAPSRIIAGEGRDRGEMMIELWIVPEGAAPPEIISIAAPSEVKPAKKAQAKKIKGKKA